MEFLDEMPAEEQPKNNEIKTKEPTEGFGLEIGSLTFYMGEVELEIKDVRIKDMDEFKQLLFEILSQ
jgi:hypothetical protein